MSIDHGELSIPNRTRGLAAEMLSPGVTWLMLQAEIARGES